MPIKWCPRKSKFYQASANSNYVNRRARSLATAGTYPFNFYVPQDFRSLISVKVILYPTAGAAGAGKDVDITGEYTLASGDLNTQFTFTDTTSTYDFGTANTRADIDLTSLFTNLAPGTEGGFTWTNNTVGGTIYIVGVEMIYI